MSWRTANSLIKLRDQLNKAYPNRSIASDGFIGDASHAAVASDHNPNQDGVVCAFDITHSPQTGLDAHALADSLLAVKHPNLKFIISNGRIAGAWTYWRRVSYSGIDQHDTHIHVSVGNGDEGRSRQPYDDITAWNINGRGEDMISDSDAEYNRWNRLFTQVRGRSAGRDEFRVAAVGRTWLQAIEILSDDKEADQATKYQTVGYIAVNDKWDQQIFDLQAAVKQRDAALAAKPSTAVTKSQVIDYVTKNLK